MLNGRESRGGDILLVPRPKVRVAAGQRLSFEKSLLGRPES